MGYLQDIYFTNLNAVFNLGGFFSIDKGDNWEHSLHVFEQCKFYYVIDGECRITIDNTEYVGRAGDWFLIPAGVCQAYKNDETKPFKKFWLHFDLYPGVDIIKNLQLPYVVKAEYTGKIKRLFNDFIKFNKSSKLTDKLLLKGTLINLIAEYFKLARPEGVNVHSRTDERMDNLLRFINENLEKDLPLELLAERYYAHPNHFIRAFKDKTGLTPARYVRLRRMETAKRLIESSDLNFEEICVRTGINDLSHFSKLFKQSYNMSPREYREYFKKDFIV